ncbi:MAG: serine/threonine-protein kinase [Vicinamibacterales bacterium]
MTAVTDAALERLASIVADDELQGTRYRVLDEVGRGGMGVVYRAWDPELEREVAVKVIEASAPAGASLVVRLRREACVLARLAHPGIVPVYDAGTLVDGRPYYVMRLIDGQSLATRLRTLGTIPDRLSVFLRVCDAVACAHSHGVLHRDLTPANIMVGAYGEVLVLDWGVAKQARPDPPDVPAGGGPTGAGTAHGTVVGTPGYMAPEQRRAEPDVDARVDVFALGVLLGELLSTAASEVPSPLSSIRRKASADVRSERYGRVEDLAADVRRWLAHEPVVAHPETLRERVVRMVRRNQLAFALIWGYLVVRLLLLLLER